jgi:hypothetical protein
VLSESFFVALLFFFFDHPLLSVRGLPHSFINLPKSWSREKMVVNDKIDRGKVIGRGEKI